MTTPIRQKSIKKTLTKIRRSKRRRRIEDQRSTRNDRGNSKCFRRQAYSHAHAAPPNSSSFSFLGPLFGSNSARETPSLFRAL
jgi:hypothetical protein